MLFKKLALRVGGIVPIVLRDGAGLAGVGLVSYGAYLVTPSAGFIVGGALLITGAMLFSGGSAPPPTQGG